MTPSVDQALLAHLWDRSRLVLLLADPDGIIRRHNAQAVRVFGGNLQGKPLGQVLGSDTPSGEDSLLRVNVMVSEDRAETFYFRIDECREGRLAIGETDPEEFHRLRRELGESHTELSLLNRQLQKNAVELEHLNRLKNRFLGIAAHDLRNPLSILYGHARLIERLAQDGPPEIRESVSTMMASTQYAMRLLDDLLDISQIESGQWRLERAETELIPWMNRVLDRQEPLAAQKEIRIERHFQEPLPPVSLDPIRFEQVVGNLLSNAVKYSPRGSIAQVTMRAVDGGVEIAVADQGPGIPPDETARLFEDFSRTSVRPTGGEKSTGLGLSIVRRIVEAHGGKVRADSVVGRGTTFTVWMPLEPPKINPI